MPYSDSLLDLILEDYGFDKEYSIKCIEANRHNHITATYHLVNKRNLRAASMKEPRTNNLEDSKKGKFGRFQTDTKKVERK